MSTAPLPLQPFASEPHAAPVAAAPEGSTLTLQLRAAPGAMSGRLALREPAGPAPGSLRLRVAIPPKAPLTFTA